MRGVESHLRRKSFNGGGLGVKLSAAPGVLVCSVSTQRCMAICHERAVGIGAATALGADLDGGRRCTAVGAELGAFGGPLGLAAGAWVGAAFGFGGWLVGKLIHLSGCRVSICACERMGGDCDGRSARARAGETGKSGEGVEACWAHQLTCWFRIAWSKVLSG